MTCHQSSKSQHGYNKRSASLRRNTKGATEPYRALPEDKLRYVPLRPPLRPPIPAGAPPATKQGKLLVMTSRGGK